MEKRWNGVPDARAEVRINMFLAATVRSGGHTQPVRVRDLSASGARLEPVNRLPAGAAITLVRGSLMVEGRVTWSDEQSCGVEFFSPVSVQHWLATARNRRQQSIDQHVGIVKAGAEPPPETADGARASAAALAADLHRLSKLLEGLGDGLASDPDTVARHGDELQKLDIALQILAALRQSAHGDAEARAASLARLEDLRTSCAEAIGARH